MSESDVCSSGINEAKRSPEEQNNLSDSGLNSAQEDVRNSRTQEKRLQDTICRLKVEFKNVLYESGMSSNPRRTMYINEAAIHIGAAIVNLIDAK